MNRLSSILLVAVLAAIAATSPAAAKDPAPAGRTYFILVVGLDEDLYRPQADCLKFDPTQVCTLDGQMCFDWFRVEGGVQEARESGFALTAEIDDGEAAISLDGQGRVDSRGNRSSISFAGHLEALGQRLNFSFSGRQVGAAKCMRMASEFEVQTASQ